MRRLMTLLPTECLTIYSISPRGMGFASDFGEAAKLLEDVYDEDLEAIKNIEFCHLDDYVITLPREVLRKYKNEEYADRIFCDEEGRELTRSVNCGREPF